jgi:hypothetical protein
MRFMPRLLLYSLGLMLLATTAQGLEIKTSDGLTLKLDDQTGRIEAVRVGDQKLAQKAASHPLRLRRFEPRGASNLVPNPGFEEGDKSPQAWRLGTGAARVERTASDATNRFCGRVSTPKDASQSNPVTSGTLLSDAIPAKPGCTYRWSAWGMVVPGGSGGTVYVKELDAQGQTLYENKFVVQHALSWRSDSSGRWIQKEATFITKPNCAKLQIYANIWKGYGEFCMDDLELVDGEMAWKDIAMPDAMLQPDQAGSGCSQRLVIPNEGLEVELRYTAHKNHIRIDTTLRDVENPPRERGLQVEYVVPIDLDGWTWHDDGRRSRGIAAGNVEYENAFPVADGRMSRYPFASVSKGQVGLSLAVPMDEPRLQNFLAGESSGYRTVVELGLSPHTLRMGAGRATFVTLLYRHDGQWGFRAAAQKYYAMFPQYFVNRTKRDGTWFFVVRMSSIPNYEDFGARFYEGFPSDPKERRAMHDHGMLIFPYIEPWGQRQGFPGIAKREEMPPLEDRLRILRQWADDRQSVEKLRGGPRWEVAQATLNSLPYDADGNPCGWRIDLYSQWSQWWMTNANPRLPEPNRALTCKRYEIDPVFDEADGLYLDSVTLHVANYLNFRREHFAVADLPLVVDRRTGRPALLGMFSQTEFMTWLADDMHRRGKLLHMNIFPDAYRFAAHLADVLGCEVGRFGRRSKNRNVETDDANDLLRRTLAYHKPTTNLLQDGNFHQPVPELSHADVVDHLKRQLFYGFYPGIATIGGEEKPGYKGWKRYFGTPAQYERDREVFKRVVEMLDLLSAAGWEPIPYARTSNERVWIERFGEGRSTSVYFTLHNPGQTKEDTAVAIQTAGLGIPAAKRNQVVVRELMSDSPLTAKVREPEGAIEFTLSLAPQDTAVVRVEIEEARKQERGVGREENAKGKM